MKKLLSKFKTDQFQTGIALALFELCLMKIIDSCVGSPLHLRLLMHLAAITLCTTNYLYLTYDDLNNLTLRHEKWETTYIIVKVLYFIIGVSILSRIIGLFLNLSRIVLFTGKDGKAMTWEDIKLRIKPLN